MKIEIECHSPVDGDYFLVIIDDELFAKTYKFDDAAKIKGFFEDVEELEQLNAEMLEAIRYFV